MQINELKLENFRNYAYQQVTFDPCCNVIFGENGQGKTNLLESLVYLSQGKSPRTRREREMISFLASSAHLTAKMISREREFCVVANLFRDRRRKIEINQVSAAKSGVSLSQILQTVLFRPEDLFLIREGAATRRKFLDTALCQLRPRYQATLCAYERAYDHKTRILRDSLERPDLLEMLPDFNEQMIRSGAILIDYRRKFVLRLEEFAQIHHRECTGGREKLEIKYQTVSTVDLSGGVGEIEEQLRSHMNSHQEAERISRLCLSGPHKDDLCVKIDGREAKDYGSQGQVRTAALAMKLAEREIYYRAFGEYPVLLLDDVLSELDSRRQEFVLNRIGGGQVFITCCEDDRLPNLLGGRVFHVHEGIIAG